MRIVLMLLLAGASIPAMAQPSFGIGVGSAGGCREVSRQILDDWFDVKDVFAAEAGMQRPRSSDFHCVAPESMQNALPKRLMGSDLRCFVMNRRGVCCDAEMRGCATLE